MWLVWLLPSAALAAASAQTQSRVQGFLKKHGETAVHCAIAVWCMRSAVQSVRTDEWAAIRMRPPEQQADRARIFKKRRRAAKVGQFLGAGYTPRIVFLAGMMLRSLQMSTRVQDVFDPSLGYAAGATLAGAAARCALSAARTPQPAASSPPPLPPALAAEAAATKVQAGEPATEAKEGLQPVYQATSERCCAQCGGIGKTWSSSRWSTHCGLRCVTHTKFQASHLIPHHAPPSQFPDPISPRLSGKH